jgi:hypothetical protein
MIPQKTMVKVAENGNFSDELLINAGNVLIIRKVIPGSGLYNLYLQAVTGLAIPQGGMPSGGVPPIGLTS